MSLWGRVKRSVQFHRERDEIIADMQKGLYTVSETMRRLEEHKKPGGSERRHRFTCREGILPCNCPFKFDVAKWRPLSERSQTSEQNGRSMETGGK